ncbi:AMP-dependent synthetase/ligase [Halorubrum ezzemoulense]|uniref:AMP-dependent synthetase/ligase n=1 Tax=Halorubrum ezzemoulense TaxID=337243 RepID=UPI00232C98C2|nr:long-chain fatty acid--CoA ligase [Halorubrum ezzemoulense]MDB9253497.1 long-chain fatty acid--CoA ligase [Halorubrum ezzemoulense]MDB9254373.1 long-chain fatty acid--CoA ligase [Halorubrum ezzemoulense]MDB9275084.1 long-chain fatty acid--CoA ligase [Halorubrum ezzemoulense]
MSWQEAERAFTDDAIARETLPATFERTAERHADRIAQRYKGGVHDRSLVASGVVPEAPAGEYADVTYAEMRGIVRNLATGLRELGVDDDTRLAMYSQTRMEWAQTDFAALAAGAVVTTVYASSSPSQLRYLLEDPEATVVVAENREMLREVLAVRGDLEHDLDAIVTLDEVDTDDLGDDADADVDDVYTLGEVHERGAAAFDEAAYGGWLDAVGVDDLASLIYTSGTTGKPKGVRLTHGNFRDNVSQCYRRFADRPDRDPEVPGISAESTTLSFLPLAHVFERMAGHYMMFAAGATVAYAESPDTLREDFGLVRPTTTTSVPRVYEKLYDAIREQASESPVKERIFEWAVDVGRDHHEADAPGPLLDAKRAVADRLVFSSVREAIGGNIDFFISGGGSLSAELCALYHAMDLPILEGYGLTETSPVICVNPPEKPKVGTIGPPVVDTEIAIDGSVVGQEVADLAGEVGELLVRGPQVTDGYWNRPDATADAFVDADGLPTDAVTAGTPADDRVGVGGDGPGDAEAAAAEPWFRTGDIVQLRPDGYVAFRERAKQLLVLSTGKNVAPGPIEDRFAANEFVEQCVVLGDGRKFVSALIVPNFERVEAWAEANGIDLPAERTAVCRDDRVRERIQEEVDRVNEEFESYEKIKQFRLVEEEFTEENDLLTPTMKKKRRNILDRFADEVEVIYEE